MSNLKEEHNWRTGEMRKLGWKERQREQSLINFFGSKLGPAEASHQRRDEYAYGDRRREYADHSTGQPFG